MRRRRRGERTLTAKELVRTAESLRGYGAVGGTPSHDQWLAGLREVGYDPVDYFRARFWLRRGASLGYGWDVH